MLLTTIIREISNPDQESITTDATISNITNTGVTHSLAGRTTSQTINIGGMPKANDIKDKNAVNTIIREISNPDQETKT